MSTGERTAFKPPSERTYGRKKGYLTATDTARLQRLLPQYALPPGGGGERTALLTALGADPERARLWLEIGFGNGAFLAALAAQNPLDRLIGVEVFQEGIAALAGRLERQGLDNVRIVTDGVHQVLSDAIPQESLDRVVINFPDPWPKKRHHKRRLVQGPFLDLLATRMRAGALLTLATDWENYAEWMLAALEAHPLFENRAGPGAFADQPDPWLETRFQQKGRAAGRPTWHLASLRR